MRVLIAASIYPPDAGGPATHAKAQLEGFPKLGVETELVALAHYRKWPPFVRHYLYLVKLLSLGWKCDVIYAHDAWGTGFPALIASTVLNKKLIVRVGGDVAWERAGEKKSVSLRDWYEAGEYKKNTMYRLSRVVLQSANKIVVTSRILVDLYSEHYGISRDKIKLIINPTPKVEMNNLPTDRTIIFASRLVAYKNLDLLLQAMAPIFHNQKDLKLTILGDGPERGQLEKIADNLNIRESVEFVGHVSQEEVLRRTEKCLFTIAPALTEFNPNYVLQGIGMGKPFLVSWENGLPFDIPENLQFNPRSIEDIRDKATNLLTEGGYKKAEEFVGGLSFNMSWDANLRENLEVIQEVLSGSK